jgi:hypothetical protein
MIGNMVRHQVKPGEAYDLRIVGITPVTEQADGTGPVTAYELKLEGIEDTVQIPSKDPVPIVFSMKEMGFEFPVVTEDRPINKTYKMANPNYEPPARGSAGYAGSSGYGGMGGGVPGMGAPGASGSSSASASLGAGMGPGRGGGGMGAGRGGFGGRTGARDDEAAENIEPPTLIVPRYDFTLQVVWKETLLSERLKAQADAWLEQQQGGTTSGGSSLALNTSGGA